MQDVCSGFESSRSNILRTFKIGEVPFLEFRLLEVEELGHRFCFFALLSNSKGELLI